MYIFQVINQYWPSAVFAFILIVFLCVIALKVFPKVGLMDRPNRYGLERAPIPYYGGIILYVAFVVSVLVFAPLTSEVIGLLVSSGVIFGIGFFDDLFDVRPLVRLFFQFAAAGLLVFSGVGILSINLPFIGALDFSGYVFYGIPMLSAVFTILWVMAIVNVMNFLDGVSGLNSGITFIASFTLFMLSIHPWIHEDPTSQQGVAVIALIVAMIALGFFIFDFPKPKILMGDSGSTLFGFLLATLSIFSGGKVATAFLVLGIPILDMVWVVLRRILDGKKFWEGDLKHLHHRFLDFGLGERGVVLMYLTVSAIFGVSAIIFVSLQQKLFMIVSLVVLMVLLASALVFVPRRK